MTAATLNLEIERYATFNMAVQVKVPAAGETTVPEDITGYIPHMQVRASAEANEVLLDMTVDNGRLVIMNAVTGQLRLQIAASDTTNLAWTSGVYDLVLVKSADDTRRLLQGAIIVSQGVTR